MEKRVLAALIPAIKIIGNIERARTRTLAAGQKLGRKKRGVTARETKTRASDTLRVNERAIYLICQRQSTRGEPMARDREIFNQNMTKAWRDATPFRS